MADTKNTPEIAEEKKAAPGSAAKKSQKDQAKDKYCVYIGPTMRGGLTEGAIIKGDKPTALQSLPDALAKYPNAERLVVGAHDLPRALQEVSRQGSLLWKAYQEIKKEAK